MSKLRTRGWLAAACVLLVCTGCGFKGPLYLPERNATVVTHPGQAAPSSNRTQAPAAKGKDKVPPAPPPLPTSSSPPPQ